MAFAVLLAIGTVRSEYRANAGWILANSKFLDDKFAFFFNKPSSANRILLSTWLAASDVYRLYQ